MATEKSSPGKIVRQKVIPMEVNAVWGWVKTFDQQWIPHFPAITSIELVSNQASKKDGKSSKGVVRMVKMTHKDEVHSFKERLDFCKSEIYTLIYSLLEYHKNSDVSASKDGDSAIDVRGTLFTIKLKGALNEVDQSPETKITWICQFNPEVPKLKELAENVFTLSIDSCLNEMERKFNEPIGKCTIFLKGAKNLMTADMFSSDPYCILRMSDMTSEAAKKSRVKKWTKNPAYNEDFEFEVRPRSLKLILTFWDYDGVGDGDDPMGSAEMDFSDLEDGVQKDMTLDLNTEGQVMFTIKLEMNDKKQIPISPTLKKQRLEAEKATQGINEGSKTDGAKTSGGDSGCGAELLQFVQAKFVEDCGQMLNETQCRIVANSFLYLSSYREEIKVNINSPEVQEKNVNKVKENASNELKGLLAGN